MLWYLDELPLDSRRSDVLIEKLERAVEALGVQEAVSAEYLAHARTMLRQVSDGVRYLQQADDS